MKVILNYLPPGRIEHPSTSLSILQSFLKHNGFECHTIYWNLIFFQLMTYFKRTNDVYTNLFPFFAALSEEFNDEDAKKRLADYLQRLNPFFKTKKDFYINSIDEIRNSIFQLFNNELVIDKNQALLYGISAKFYQWIPGRYLAREIKKIYPNSKVVVGGVDSREGAMALLRKNPEFDYAIWGEGEYPLLELCKYLENQSVSISQIPRLIYRNNDEIKPSLVIKSELLDFDNYIFPDINDFFEYAEKYKVPKQLIQVFLNTICGCYWNKCSFCSYSNAKKFRERRAENIFEEIKTVSKKYDINNFYIADNEIVGKDIKRFENLLDLLIDFKENVQNDFQIYGELIPTAQISDNLLAKMSRAGFKYIFIGYEAITDSLLMKMRKENSFSENLMFVKLALKNNIIPQANIIMGIPNETEDDIHESVNNLHFLRFFFNNKQRFAHNFISLNIYKGTEYYRKMTKEEEPNYSQNYFNEFLPEKFISKNERFDFFQYRRNVLINNQLWDNLRAIEDYYKKNKFNYEIEILKSGFIYKEYLNNNVVKTLEYETVFFDIINIADTEILTFNEIKKKLLKTHPKLDDNNIINYLNELKSNYLIYFDEKMEKIVSVISLGA